MGGGPKLDGLDLCHTTQHLLDERRLSLKQVGSLFVFAVHQRPRKDMLSYLLTLEADPNLLKMQKGRFLSRVRSDMLGYCGLPDEYERHCRTQDIETLGEAIQQAHDTHPEYVHRLKTFTPDTIEHATALLTRNGRFVDIAEAVREGSNHFTRLPDRRKSRSVHNYKPFSEYTYVNRALQERLGGKSE